MSVSAHFVGKVAQEVDATGLKCPMPVLRAQRVLRMMQTGEVLCLKANDEAARKEIPLFCEHVGAKLLAVKQQEDMQLYWLCKMR